MNEGAFRPVLDVFATNGQSRNSISVSQSIETFFKILFLYFQLLPFVSTRLSIPQREVRARAYPAVAFPFFFFFSLRQFFAFS